MAFGRVTTAASIPCSPRTEVGVMNIRAYRFGKIDIDG